MPEDYRPPTEADSEPYEPGDPDPVTEATARIRAALSAEPPDLDAAIAALPAADADPLGEVLAELDHEGGPDFERVREALNTARTAAERAKPVPTAAA